MISDKLRLLKENTGTASVIEAVLVYPAVILACSFLIYSGLFMCEESMLCDIAQKTAEYKADILSCGDSMTFSTTDELKIQDIRKIYEKKGKQPGKKTDSEIKIRTEKRMLHMLLSQKKVKCSIKTEQMLYGSKITVDLERNVRMPGVMKVFSKDGIITERAAATEVSSDFFRLMGIQKAAEKYINTEEHEDEENEKNDSRKQQNKTP